MIDRKKLGAMLSGQRRKVRGIRPNKALESNYRNTLLNIVREITAFNMAFAKSLKSKGMIQDSMLSDYDAAFRARFSDRYERLAENYPEKWIGKADEAHKKAFIGEINNKIGVDLTQILKDKTSRVGRTITHRTKANSDLIVSLVDDYKEQARDAIHDVLINGDTSETLRTRLEHIDGVTKSRAKLIARDQTQKVCSELNAARQQDVGITGYFWRGNDDGRERDSHIENNNKRFDWDNPPAETGHPGEDIQCRCTADPDLTGFLNRLIS